MVAEGPARDECNAAADVENTLQYCTSMRICAPCETGTGGPNAVSVEHDECGDACEWRTAEADAAAEVAAVDAAGPAEPEDAPAPPVPAVAPAPAPARKRRAILYMYTQ